MADPIEHRVREARLLVELLRSEKSALASQVVALAHEVLATKKLPAELAIAPVLELLADLLEHATKELERAQRALLNEQADDDEPRGRRDDVVLRLVGFATRFREQVTSVGGVAAVRRLGLLGATPREPEALRTVLQVLFENLPKLKLPKESDDGSSLDLKKATAGAERDLAALEGALKDVAREAREEQVAREGRNKSLARFDRIRNAVVWSADGLFTLVGRDEIVERLRLVEARSRGELVDAGDDEEKSPEKPAKEDPKPTK